MKFILHPHKHADVIMNAEAPSDWKELQESIRGISDDEIAGRFEASPSRGKSISETINGLLKERLVALGWKAEAPIFQDPNYQDNRWRLDFAKGHISVEVAFNHGEAIAWNLLKPVLASEYNHVAKAIQTRFGVIVCATEDMKRAGGFDSAVGTFEKFGRYLMPLQNPLSVPIMLLGLQPPETFRINHRRDGNRWIGEVQRL